MLPSSGLKWYYAFKMVVWTSMIMLVFRLNRQFNRCWCDSWKETAWNRLDKSMWTHPFFFNTVNPWSLTVNFMASSDALGMFVTLQKFGKRYILFSLQQHKAWCTKAIGLSRFEVEALSWPAEPCDLQLFWDSLEVLTARLVGRHQWLTAATPVADCRIC